MATLDTIRQRIAFDFSDRHLPHWRLSFCILEFGWQTCDCWSECAAENHSSMSVPNSLWRNRRVITYNSHLIKKNWIRLVEQLLMSVQVAPLNAKHKCWHWSCAFFRFRLLSSTFIWNGTTTIGRIVESLDPSRNCCTEPIQGHRGRSREWIMWRRQMRYFGETKLMFSLDRGELTDFRCRKYYRDHRFVGT